VCYSVLQCAAVGCRVLQCVGVCRKLFFESRVNTKCSRRESIWKPLVWQWQCPYVSTHTHTQTNTLTHTHTFGQPFCLYETSRWCRLLWILNNERRIKQTSNLQGPDTEECKKKYQICTRPQILKSAVTRIQILVYYSTLVQTNVSL